MQYENRHQIWWSNKLDIEEMPDNKQLTMFICNLLRDQYSYKAMENIAAELKVGVRRVQNWFYNGTGMTAIDLLLILHKYEFIKKHLNL